jgi:hypothetical protein
VIQLWTFYDFFYCTLQYLSFLTAIYSQNLE